VADDTGTSLLDGVGSGGGGGVSLPSWLPTSFSGFRNLVIGVISSWVVLGILDVLEVLVDSILVVTETIGSVGGTLGGAVVDVGSTIGSVPTTVLSILEELVVEIAASSGPAAPFVVGVLGAGVLLVLIWTARATWSLWLAVLGRLGIFIRGLS
jgi:hypothetical protein